MIALPKLAPPIVSSAILMYAWAPPQPPVLSEGTCTSAAHGWMSPESTSGMTLIDVGVNESPLMQYSPNGCTVMLAAEMPLAPGSVCPSPETAAYAFDRPSVPGSPLAPGEPAAPGAPSGPAGPPSPRSPCGPCRPAAPRCDPSCPFLKSFARRQPLLTCFDVTVLAGSFRAASPLPPR